MQRVSFFVGGQKLVGELFYPAKLKEKNPAILFVHGWTGNKNNSYQYATALAKLGFISLLFDMRGHGESEGNINAFTISDFLTDVYAAYDFLLKCEGVDIENISGVGSSFGCYLLSILSENREIKNLVLRAPADYPNDHFNNFKMEASGTDNAEIVVWRNQSKKSNETFALKAVSNYEGEILIIESEKDNSVPHESTMNYVNAVKDKNKLTHAIVKDAPHSIKEGKFRDKVTEILANWFGDKL